MKQNNTFYKFILLLLSAVLASVFAQQPPRTMSTVDAELSCICGKESSPYAERVRLIHRLPSNLAPEQVERCRAFLESSLAGQPLPDLEFNGLKNELVFALLRQREGLTELSADEITPDVAEAVRGAKVLHLDGHNAAGAIAAAKIAKDAGVLVSYDAGTIREGMNELLPLADLLICSGEFAVSVAAGKDKLITTGYTEDEVEAAVRKLYAKYRPKVCGATMGVRGSMCFDGERLVKCPAFKVEKVVDTTGCGDLFHTGFALRYLETQDLMECQRFGAAVSALKCRGLSGRPPSAPTRAEVEAFLAAH